LKFASSNRPPAFLLRPLHQPISRDRFATAITAYVENCSSLHSRVQEAKNFRVLDGEQKASSNRGLFGVERLGLNDPRQDP